MSETVKRYTADVATCVDVIPAESVYGAKFVLASDYAALEAENARLRAVQDVNQQLLEALEKVDSEHEILGRMKTCELRRGRGSFGIAVMSDELALDWQSHQKDLERLIGLRLAAIAAARKGEV